MNCHKCNTEAPANIAVFPGNVWTCGKCFANKGKNLKDELIAKYMSGVPGRYCYISEFTNNLDKIQNGLVENIDLSNPFCSITLVETQGVIHLDGQFDGVYIDRNSVPTEALSTVHLYEHGYIKFVDPTTQEILE